MSFITNAFHWVFLPICTVHTYCMLKGKCSQHTQERITFKKNLLHICAQSSKESPARAHVKCRSSDSHWLQSISADGSSGVVWLAMHCLYFSLSMSYWSVFELQAKQDNCSLFLSNAVPCIATLAFEQCWKRTLLKKTHVKNDSLCGGSTNVKIRLSL